MAVTGRDTAFLDQLRSALTNAADESLDSMPDAVAHIDLLRELLDVLMSAASAARTGDFELNIVDEQTRRLCANLGGFWLACCGFEVVEAGRQYKLAQAAYRNVQLALPVVSGALDAYRIAAKDEFPDLQETPRAPSPLSAGKADSTPASSAAPAASAPIPGLPNQAAAAAAAHPPSPSASSTSPPAARPPNAAPGPKAGAAAMPKSPYSSGMMRPPAMSSVSTSPKSPVSSPKKASLGSALRNSTSALAAKIMAPLPKKSEWEQPDMDEDAQLAVALVESMQDASGGDSSPSDLEVERPGLNVLVAELAEAGIIFERQPQSTDTCAIHSLNNISQHPRPPEEAAAALAASVAAAAAAEEGEDCDASANFGLFRLADLQQAEAASRRDQLSASFLMPSSERHLSLLRRSQSTAGNPSSPVNALNAAAQRTGMFDVEAVKLAAQTKDYEIIDIEPTPCWEDAEAARYVEAARKTDDASAVGRIPAQQRWFLGFLVYERIPGRAMHYYSILRWHSREGVEQWILLDSLDAGRTKSRNRVMTFDELVTFYNMNSEWFKSWLVRWYPVVHKATAYEALRTALLRGLAEQGLESNDKDNPSDVVSALRAEEALDSERVRWNVCLAAEDLLAAVPLVSRELQVLRLALGESQARRELARAGWDLERAVKNRAERVLRLCSDTPGSPAVNGEEAEDGTAAATDVPLPEDLQGQRAANLALSMADWDVRSAAQLLLLAARVDQPRLPRARKALKACDWDLDSALAVLRLMTAEQQRAKKGAEEGAEGAKNGEEATADDESPRNGKSAKAPDLSEDDASRILEAVNFDASRAQGRIRDLAVKVGELPGTVLQQVRLAEAQGCAPKRPLGLRGKEEAEELALLALDAADWNPAGAFCTAESFALGLTQVRVGLWDRERQVRSRAIKTVNACPSQTKDWLPAPGGSKQPTAEQVAAALGALDAMDAAADKEPGPTAILQALTEEDMDPQKVCLRLWDVFKPLEAAPFDVASPERKTSPAREPKPRGPPPPPPPPPPGSGLRRHEKSDSLRLPLPKGSSPATAATKPAARKQGTKDCKMM
eukprot:TRINITY_DN53272_c0_g1_i1.p1 TRINITY_DN53272_c0_g1~~TRINITY_DN53272_c0_g1_i1.p1  ORF type:complete len:1068 (-),score=273.92 TRINITY_DN53272_c0_g1_i1:85-3288(-)